MNEIENETFEKTTEGWITQTFDRNGVLLDQKFTAGDRCEGAIEFYSPFEMVQPDMQKVEFNIYDSDGGDDLIGIVGSKEIEIPEVVGEVIDDTLRRAIETAQREYGGEFAFTVEDIKNWNYDSENILEIAFLEN